MVEHLLLFLGLLGGIILIILLSNRIRVAYPVLLVLAGLLLSLVPEMPRTGINPEIVLFVLLPPLLYAEAWEMSWKELWRWRRIVGNFAFALVFLSSIVVALVANAIIPGFSLALGFLLGGIVSPPDAVSASAILKFVEVPRRLAILLKGESLFNDASSLLVFRFAAIAVTTGQFVWYVAVGSFIWMIVGGIALGVLLAYLIGRLHKYLHMESSMDVLVTLITPYLMYILAEEIHTSGVIAVVSGGLFMSYHRYNVIRSSSQLQGVSVWNSFIFLLNGLVFILIGLELPTILEGMKANGIDIYTATGYGVVITIVLILTRILAAYGAVYFTLFIKKYAYVADERHPGNKTPLVLGWSGMRGVVSLAAALSIPMMSNGAPFPYRNLIIYITFVVILLTLIIQGLTLPALIRWAKLSENENMRDHMEEEETIQMLRTYIAENSLRFIKENYSDKVLKSYYLNAYKHELEDHLREHVADQDQDQKYYREVLAHQRALLIEKNKELHIDEEIIRQFLRIIDLEEEKLNKG